MKPLLFFVRMFNLHMLLVLILCVAAITLTLYFEFSANLPTGLIGVTIIFPVVFAINASFKRREEALRYFSGLKAHLVAIFYASRDWLPSHDPALAKECKEKILSVFDSLKSVLQKEADLDGEGLKHVYEKFSDISKFNEKLRAAGLPTGEMSRISQYLKAAMNEFEKMRNISVYRTPLTLRAFSQVFLNAFPILFAPYFAQLAVDHNNWFIGYGVGVLYTVVLVSLDNIQGDLENPYDAVGEDDLRLDLRHQYEKVLSLTDDI